LESPALRIEIRSNIAPGIVLDRNEHLMGPISAPCGPAAAETNRR